MADEKEASLLDILFEIEQHTLKGEDLLDDGIIDIAFDQFVDIRSLVRKAKELVNDPSRQSQ